VFHTCLSTVNILDWGVNDTKGFRGWGGGNSENAIVGIKVTRQYSIRFPNMVSLQEW
jgi:hypothetical protein